MPTNAVAVCEDCGDALPVVVSTDGGVEPLRAGESCMCGDETFRVVDPAEIDEGSNGCDGAGKRESARPA